MTKYNDFGEVTARKLYTVSDGGTLEPGKYIDVPLGELGQALNPGPDIFSPLAFKKLRHAVEDYMNLVK